MLLLDTNILSAVMGTRPAPEVASWMTQQAADLMIASIARAHGASVVTRDTGDFAGCGLALINPWAPS
jgi:predicted nucleic acid-binding protein